MKKLNCWEMTECGREPGGNNIDDLGVCPAASDEKSTGINGGKNAGRICWAVAGTFCSGETKGSLASSIASCMICEVYEQIRHEESNETFHLVNARVPRSA